MMHHLENHQTERIGWLRAAVLGANDGIISTASLMLGLITSGANSQTIVLTGLAGLVAGSMSMAAGEYVSVHSQSDTEDADLAKEKAELLADPEHEHEELAAIYQARGLDAATANMVATQLMAHDALGAHARDELGITETLRAKPIQAAVSSALAFSVGAALPILTVFSVSWFYIHIAPAIAIMVTTVLFLAFLGLIAAKAGGIHHRRALLTAAIRVVVWGVLAMLFSAAAGQLFGTVIQ
jgi:VIT1/CCC1 family predicted Fe2+/Mn2+ transporter